MHLELGAGLPRNMKLLKGHAGQERSMRHVDFDDRACECVQVDVDEWDARGCDLHGPRSSLYQRQLEADAADLVAYYSGPDPFEESVGDGTDTNRAPLPADVVKERKQR